MCEPVAQPPGVGELELARDRWITINTIWDMVGGYELGRHAYQPSETNTIGLFLEVAPHAPTVWSQRAFVAALSHALNEAISGYPRSLERFLPSDLIIEQLLQARSKRDGKRTGTTLSAMSLCGDPHLGGGRWDDKVASSIASGHATRKVANCTREEIH